MLNAFLLRSYQPLQTYCLHVLPTGPPQMVLWCRRSGRQRPSLYTGMGSAKRNQHCSTLLYIAHVIADLIPVIQRQRRQTPQCPGKSQKYPRIQIITVQLGSWCSCSWCRWHASKRVSTLHARRKSTSPCKESLTGPPQLNYALVCH